MKTVRENLKQAEDVLTKTLIHLTVSISDSKTSQNERLQMQATYKRLNSILRELSSLKRNID